MKKIINYFSCFELLLWAFSSNLILISFFIFDGESYLTLLASLIGVTSLIFSAKGNPIGQFLMIVFSLIYGVISYSFKYYGEMITYLGMTLPMSLFSLIAWIKNPYKGKKSEVMVNNPSKKNYLFMICSSLLITFIFYFILKHFNTKNIILSTISVLTSFVAVYLTFFRSPFFALAYVLNDLVLIALWILASIENLQYISVVVCFFAFSFNDLYCFCNWQRIKKRQNNK